MNKLYVLDTNVILHDASSIEKFADNTVIIPLVVIDEIDRFKGRQDAVGSNAREATRLLDSYRGRGSLLAGVNTPAGGIVKVIVDGAAADCDLPEGLDKNLADNQILRLCLGLKREWPDITLITKDINMRLRADALGIRAENYLEDKAYPLPVPHRETYTGICDLVVSEEEIDTLFRERSVPATSDGLMPNQFVRLKSEHGRSSAIGQVSRDKDRLALVDADPVRVWGMRSRNLRQSLALHLLLDPEIPLVTLTGRAGTGKTLLALAAGLELVLEEQRYKKLLVSRPIIAFGNEIGYLPGGKDEKLTPWMAAIYDNLELLVSGKGGKKGSGGAMAFLQNSDIFEVEALTYIRGRSIPNQYMIVDEAQNLTPHEVKTIVSRIGEGTKLVLTGDVLQIDHPFLDEMNNGLTYAVERLKGSPMVGHLTLDKGERSPLAELAASRL